jgi:DNA-binding CsgD family transcriptional regulator
LLAERSVAEALIALCDAANGNGLNARRLAHLVISRSARRFAGQSPVEHHLGQITRVVASCTCIIVGDSTRGRRALTRIFDPSGAFAAFTNAAPLDEDGLPPYLRGYARAINAALAAMRRIAPPCDLTKTQAIIPRMLCDGMTSGEIAKEQGRSRNTIVNHVTRFTTSSRSITGRRRSCALGSSAFCGDPGSECWVDRKARSEAGFLRV